MAETTVALALLLLDEEESNENFPEKRNKYWVKPWLRNKSLGCYNSLFQELKNDEKAFKEFIGMEESQFEFLVQSVYSQILKEDTNMRESIKPHEMVCLTLRYLATGETFRSLEYQFRIGKKTISRIVNEVCEAITEILGPRYLNTPKKLNNG